MKRTEYFREWRNKNKDKIRMYNKRWRKYKIENRLRNNTKLVIQEMAKRGNRCAICGTADKRVLVWHHKNNGIGINNRENTIASLINKARYKLEEELLKCELVCANCHMLQHPKKYLWIYL